MLAANVHFLVEGGLLVSLHAGDDVPSEYAEYLTNPALYADDEPAHIESEPAPEDAPEPDYSALRKAELIALCEERGLATWGTVANLRDRLEGDDRAFIDN